MKADKNEFFREVTLRISSSLNIAEALRSVFDYLERFIPIDTIGLHRIDMERMGIFAVAEVARRGVVKVMPDVFPVDDEFLAVIKNAEAHNALVSIQNQPETLPRSVIRCFPHMASRSVISLALRIKNEPIGGLLLSAEGNDRYTDQHASLLEIVKDPIALAMSNAWRYQEMARLKDLLVEDNRELSLDLERFSGVQVIGADFGLSQVMEMVRSVAPMSSPVLLLGETGSGKEVIANAIHLSSPRRNAPMVRVQCGAIPETLLDSELFGHEKGAFTGAIERKRGRFERADGGTIFLDEIGELTADAQVKLLRVLQEKQFERVGGSQTLTVDVRVIAATHRDLAQRVREGRFREDLWYRLNVFPIQIPPLRLRREDIPSLVQYFVEHKAREMNLEKVPRVSSENIDRLKAYDWPGNVRELQNVIERALILSRGGPLFFPKFGTLSRPQATVRAAVQSSKPKTLNEAAADHIRQTLAETGGRIAGPGGAAEILKINPSTLRSRMKKLGIKMSHSFVASE